MKFRVNHFASAILIYIVGVFIIAVVSYQQERERFIADIDQRLFAAASNLPDLLPKDFHDIARTPNAISPEQDEYNLELLSQHARSGDLTYLYSYVMVDGMIYFTTCNYTEADIANNKVVTYWTDYPEGAQEYFDAMSATEPVYVTAGDTWGLFRTILIPMTSPSGLPYIAAADMDITVIENSLRHAVLSVIVMSLVMLAIALPLIFAYRRTYKTMNAELVDLNNQLRADINQASVLEKELKQATRSANIANEIKSQFLSNMSHELRTPISGISGMNHLLLDTNLDEEQTEYVELCNKSAEVLLDTVNQILDVATIEAGGLTLLPKEVESEAFFEDIISLFSAQISERRLDLVISYVGDVPQKIIIDPVHLRKVFINLIGNAIKFTETGGIQVLLSWSDGVLRGEVIDTGMGIPEEYQSRIFEVFQQADNSYARAHGGAGLGLPISRQICKIMGGELLLSQSSEAGSVFEFNVQVAAANSEIMQPLLAVPSKVMVCSDSRLLQAWAAGELGDITVLSGSIDDIITASKDYNLILLDGTYSEDDLVQLAHVTNPENQCVLWMVWVGQKLVVDLPKHVILVPKPLRRSSLFSSCSCTHKRSLPE